jgi:hypothetical protein
VDIDDALDMLADLSSDSIAVSLKSYLERLGQDDRRVWRPGSVSEMGIDIMVSAMLFAILASRDLWNDAVFEAILASCRDGLEKTISDTESERLGSGSLTTRARHLTHMMNVTEKLGRELIYDDRVPVQIAAQTALWAQRAFPPNISDDQRLRFLDRLALHAYTQILATAVVWREICTGNQFHISDGGSRTD